ncbi:MAG TPA: DNA repair protein RecN [Salinimicrobium sp.]|nr:DNA repair protein RecN [Salinimicrobium sp.]
MLKSLSIKNFALIEDIHVDLQEGFTILTGETGAGKSIILGALSLLLGKRADYSAIRDTSKKCVIEGVFNISNYNLKAFFETEDLDFEETTIIRREILASGKSRAFINDTPTTLNALQDLGAYLIDIHSQHETLHLGDNNYQFEVMDTLAGNSDLLKTYKLAFSELKNTRRRFTDLQEQQNQAAKEYDYNLFLLNELKEAKLVNGIQKELEERHEQLNNVEFLKEHLSLALFNIQKEELGTSATLKEIRSSFQKLASFSPNYQNLLERIQSVAIEVDDIATETENLLERVEANPEELEEVNIKLQQIYNLQKKHAVSTVSELMEITAELEHKTSISENAEANLQQVLLEIKKQEENLEKISEEIHLKRKKAIPHFVEQLETTVANLGMPNARLKIELIPQQELLENGRDKLNWLLSANKGTNFLELKKAASGGELSRIMLAVKSILAKYSKLPTIIFDEIDTGVSGDIAQKMGTILQQMGSDMQVIAITHLPQIAGKGSTHFKIYKEDVQNTTVTYMKKLDEAERIEELAQMLGGKDLSSSALAHAKALLN